MKSRLSAALLLAVVFPAASLRGQDAQADLDQIQGTWAVTAMEKSGWGALKDLLAKVTVTFKGDRMIVEGPAAAFQGEGTESVKQEYTVKLDPSKTPKALDFTVVSGDLQGKTALAIYQLDGDNLKICMPNDETTQRPTEFKSPEGSVLVVMTLKRSKK